MSETATQYLNLNGQDVLDPAIVSAYRGDAKKAYINERVLGIDVLSLLPHWNDHLGHVLNIGGGAGIWEAAIAQFKSYASMTLVDKARRDVNNRVFNIKEISEEIWQKNGVNNARFLEVAPSSTENNQLTDRLYDTIVSFRALAFRFPYKWYEDVIKSQLKMGGILILDIKKTGSSLEEDSIVSSRFSSNQEQTHVDLLRYLEETLGEVTILRDRPRSLRVLVKRSK